MKSLSYALAGALLLVTTAFAPQNARADMTGDWIVDITWVQLFIDSSFQLTVYPAPIPGIHSSDLAGPGGYLLDLGSLIIQGNPNLFPGLLYVGLNFNGLDEAVGGWQQNTEVPNFGSHHMTRGTVATSDATDGDPATGSP